MRIKDTSLKIIGIGGDLAYMGGSKFQIRDEQTSEMVDRDISRIGMIAAGSGITPMYQLI